MMPTVVAEARSIVYVALPPAPSSPPPPTASGELREARSAEPWSDAGRDY